MRRRKCPYCAESIQAGARVCRWCGRDLGSETQGATAVDLPRPARSGTAVAGVLVAVLALAAAGGLGFAWTGERDRVSELEVTLAGAESQAAENASAAAEVAELRDQVEDLEGRLDAATTAGLALSDSLEARLQAARRRALRAEDCIDEIAQAYNRSTFPTTFVVEYRAAVLGGSCRYLGYTFG